MDTNEYHFSQFIEDDNLSIVAVQAKELMQQNNEIFQIFRDNNRIIYGKHPADVLSFTTQNNKSIFPSSLSNESQTSFVKSCEGISTPIQLNPDALNTNDGTGKEESSSATLECTIPIRRQQINAQPTVQATLNPMDEVGSKDEQFTSPVGSADGLGSPRSCQTSKMTSNLITATKESESPKNVVTIIEASSQESPSSAQMAKMTEKGLERPKKAVGTIEATRKESLHSSKIFKITLNIATAEKDLRSSAKAVGAIKRKNEESFQCAEKTRKSDQTVHDKGSGSLIRAEEMARNSATNTDSPKPEENAGNSDSPNKYSIGRTEEMKILKPTIIENEGPSPVKKSKMCSIPTFDIQELASPAEIVEMAENSPEETESCLPSDELKMSPNETIEELASKDRKSLSPRKNTTLFESMPRVIKLDGEEIGIEVMDLEYSTSPTTSPIKSADYPSDSTNGSNIKGPVEESDTGTSPKTPECHISPSEIDWSGKSEASSANIETDPLSLVEAILAFKEHLHSKGETVNDLFATFSTFQSSIDYIQLYVDNLSSLFAQLDMLGQTAGTEFWETIIYANRVTVSLIKKIKCWKHDIDFDIGNWHQCFQQIEELKLLYGPLLTNECQPAVTFEDLKEYESKMRVIWKKMGDMLILESTRRNLFSHVASDIERLIKMLVKCLIIVGILEPR